MWIRKGKITRPAGVALALGMGMALTALAQNEAPPPSPAAPSGQRVAGDTSGKPVTALVTPDVPRTSPVHGPSGRATAAAADREVSPADRTPAKYRIGPGDVLQINVWKEAEATVPEVVVRSDGKISLPIIKEVEALGLTPGELEKILTERFSRFIVEPQVTVLVKSINSERVYLVGAVRKEGSVRFQPSMTVLQTLAEGGGLTEFAKRRKIYVLRTEEKRQVRLPFNYDAVVRGENTEQNIEVRPGDTIVVP